MRKTHRLYRVFNNANLTRLTGCTGASFAAHFLDNIVPVRAPSPRTKLKPDEYSPLIIRAVFLFFSFFLPRPTATIRSRTRIVYVLPSDGASRQLRDDASRPATPANDAIKHRSISGLDTGHSSPFRSQRTRVAFSFSFSF